MRLLIIHDKSYVKKQHNLDHKRISISTFFADLGVDIDTPTFLIFYKIQICNNVEWSI